MLTDIHVKLTGNLRSCSIFIPIAHHLRAELKASGCSGPDTLRLPEHAWFPTQLQQMSATKLPLEILVGGFKYVYECLVVICG